MRALSLYSSVGLIFIIMVAFAYAEVFHNAMLPSVTPAEKAGEVSGLAFALGNFGAVSMMVLVLFAFALPGVQDWSFLPEQPLFGIDHSFNEHDRIVGPISGIWLLLFILPVLLFTPDGQSSGVSWQQACACWRGRGDIDAAPINSALLQHRDISGSADVVQRWHGGRADIRWCLRGR
jgi:UMF1 family MFS transporter